MEGRLGGRRGGARRGVSNCTGPLLLPRRRVESSCISLVPSLTFGLLRNWPPTNIRIVILKPNYRCGASNPPRSPDPHSRIGLLIQNLGQRQTSDIFGMATGALKPAINCGGPTMRTKFSSPSLAARPPPQHYSQRPRIIEQPMQTLPRCAGATKCTVNSISHHGGPFPSFMCFKSSFYIFNYWKSQYA